MIGSQSPRTNTRGSLLLEEKPTFRNSALPEDISSALVKGINLKNLQEQMRMVFKKKVKKNK